MTSINANVELKGSFEPLVRGFSDKTERGILRGALRRTAQQRRGRMAQAELPFRR